MSQRAMKYLLDNRIVYRRYSPDDPTNSYDWGWYYAEGTYGYYSLFNTKAKITSYKSLKWHLVVLWYLNPQLTLEKFKELAKHIAHKPNGFCTFKTNQWQLLDMVKEVYAEDLDEPPINKKRKVIFKDGTGLSVNQKLSIVGKVIGKGKSVKQEHIYDAMLVIHENSLITIKKIAEMLNCTTRTIHRNMGEELKKEKDKLNIDYEKSIY